MSSSSKIMATRQPMRMAVGLPSALATGCWPLGSSSGRDRESEPEEASYPSWRREHRGIVAQDPLVQEEAPGLLTQAAKVCGRWARWPPGSWWEGAPQSWGGVIHNICKEGREERRESDREEGPKESYLHET